MRTYILTTTEIVVLAYMIFIALLLPALWVTETWDIPDRKSLPVVVFLSLALSVFMFLR